MIRVRGLSKRFAGAGVLADVELEVEAGEALALLGTNGSGRTALLRILATLVPPSSGEVWIRGIDAVKEPLRARRHIGYAGPSPALDPRLTAGEHLELAAAARGLDREPLRRAVVEARSLAGIASDRRIEQLSDGLRQRLALAAALMSWPSVMLIDGGLEALDPVARADFVAALAARRRDGAAVVVACNSLDGLEELGGHVALLHAGRLQESLPLDGDGRQPIRLLRMLAAGASAVGEAR